MLWNVEQKQNYPGVLQIMNVKLKRASSTWELNCMIIAGATLWLYNYYKRSVLRRQSRDTNRNIKRSVYCQYCTYWQYTDLFIFRFIQLSHFKPLQEVIALPSVFQFEYLNYWQTESCGLIRILTLLNSYDNYETSPI